MRAADTLTNTELAQYPPLVYPDDTAAVVETDAVLATETVAATVMVEGLIEHM